MRKSEAEGCGCALVVAVGVIMSVLIPAASGLRDRAYQGAIDDVNLNAVVVVDGARLRRSSGTDGEILRKARRGEVFPVLQDGGESAGEHKGWVLLHVDGVTKGWIHRSLVELRPRK